MHCLYCFRNKEPKKTNGKYWFRFFIFLIILLFINAVVVPTFTQGVRAAPLPQDDAHSLDYDSVHHKTYESCGGGSASGLPELEGHKLPAAKGGAGFEEPINASGSIPSGGKVTFSGFASLGQEYRDFYITMRWRYASWAWNGASQSGPEDASWYREKPRLVLVTNPATGKSIVAAILESGPAPWTGTPGGKGDGQQRELWGGYRDDTPEGYLGRVAGFPPTAVDALGMEQWEHGGPSAGGSGHELVYSWAADQNAKPGPVNGGSSAGATSSSSSCGSVGTADFIDYTGKLTDPSINSTIQPTAIILHWWGGRGGIDSLVNTLNSRGLSVQVGITQDGKIYQLTPQLNSYAQHAKCVNKYAIGIEIEGTGATDLDGNTQQYEAVVRAVKSLMQQYNIPADGPIQSPSSAGVIGIHSHKEVDAKCPGGSGKDDVHDEYLRKVRSAVGG